MTEKGESENAYHEKNELLLKEKLLISFN